MSRSSTGTGRWCSQGYCAHPVVGSEAVLAEFARTWASAVAVWTRRRRWVSAKLRRVGWGGM
ncbi:hypothetical protein [Streptomyces sp. NPDC091259]|uniref:hypothetical protein n=1 Tax=Streptomyces sp. NPDC091259 TaxID=3365976 RepID=UPI00380235B3